MLKKPELMAPAGDMTSLIAAVENGADAVYLGVKTLNARGYANNFSTDELSEAIDYAHLRGVKVYVTLNVLIKDNEFEDAVNLLYYLHDFGTDAVILQDLGLIILARKIVPDLPVHASTQMTIHNLESVRFLENMGVERVILARELNLEQIEYIRQNTSIGIETFVHGALCISYSGQCLFSSMIGGRSGNRGFCAQPCRKKYRLYKNREMVDTKGEYLLSPKDLNTAEILPELINTGIDAFKIEGRMKRPEYVAGVVSIYRKLIDRYMKNPSDYIVYTDELKQLAQLFNRDFTTAYLLNNPRCDLINPVRPYNRGLPLGKVTGYNHKHKNLKIELSDTLNIGDGIGIEGVDEIGDTVTSIYKNGKKTDSADSVSVVAIPFKKKVKSESRVYKTFDKYLNESLEKTFTSPAPVRKVPVSIIVNASAGSYLEIQMSDGIDEISVTSDYVVEKAFRKSTSEKQVKKQIAKMGNTVFDPSKITIRSDESIFIPISQLNAIRNEAIIKLEKKRIEKWKRPQKRGDKSYKKHLKSKPMGFEIKTPNLAVNVSSTNQMKSAIFGGADIIYFETLKYRTFLTSENEIQYAAEIAHNSGCRIYLNTPNIITDNEIDDFIKILDMAKKQNFDGVLVSNLGALKTAKKMGLSVIADRTLNVFNKLSFGFILRQGAENVVLSPELTLDQIKTISSTGPAECIVHGPMEVMMSEHCFVGGIFGNRNSCGYPCRAGKYEIVDEKGFVFPMEMDTSCRTHIFNSRELCMLDNIDDVLNSDLSSIRINAGMYEPNHVMKLTGIYRNAIDNSILHESGCKSILKGHTTGHYYRGIL